MRIRRADFENLVEEGNDLAFEWPVARRYRVIAGQIIAIDEETTTLFPLFQYPHLFLSFARLGKDGEPSEQRILGWVHRYGLLTRRDPESEEPESWGDSPQEMIEPERITVSEFRTEVRTAYQLLTLYVEIRARDTKAVMRRFIDPPEPWPRTSDTLLDRHLSRYERAFGEKYRTALDNAAGLDSQLIHFKHGLDILIRCVNRKLEKVHPLLEQNWWEPPPAGSTSIGLVRWWHCPDLLAAMYLQFYLLITDKAPMRICANPHCRMPFLAPRKDKRFCSPGCRSTGRNYRH